MEGQATIMIKKNGARKSIKSMTKNDPKKGENRRKRKRKREIRRKKILSTIIS